jgi:DNA-directed RNA polymerase specialized sigma24 family protein
MSIDPPDLERQRTKWELNQESFESLLRWLSPDREQAGRRYEDIRGRLIKIFGARGCAEPDLLADETINRVAKRVEEISQTYEGEPALYFYGVANKIHMEQLRKQKPIERLPPPVPVSVPDSDYYEQEYVCLESCIGHLPARSRDLVLQYYEHETQEKIVQHQRLAERLGIGLNALRIRAHRARLVLRKCIINCHEKKSVRIASAN